MIALEQTSYTDARQMLLELEAWLRAKNESAADSLLEAFEELLTLHRLKVPGLPSYNYKLCMKGKGGGVFLMVFEIINSY